ncbi:MAG TPA: calcium-binding protein, partial [Gemmataceae bacterium]|nr:calcium-binding protein [Gemmataceae bacterium]
GPDTLSYAGYGSGVSVTLLSSTSAGFSSSSASGLAAFSGIDTLAGHAGSTLHGEVVANSTWILGGTNSYSDGSHSLTFSAFASVSDASSTKGTFTIGGGTDVTSASGNANGNEFDVNGTNNSLTLHGGAGPDTLSYAGYGSGVSVTLSSSGTNGFSSTTASGLAAFSGIDTLAGRAGSTLNGEVVANSTWALGGTNSYSDGSHSLTFSAFASVSDASSTKGTFTIGGGTDVTSATGNANGNEFDVNGSNNSLTLHGGTGPDKLSYAGYGSGVSVTLSSSGTNGFSSTTATGLAAFTGIDTLAGHAGSTLTGEAVANSTWVLGGANSYSDGSHSLTFSAFATLSDASSTLGTFTIGAGTDVTSASGNATANEFDVNGGNGSLTLHGGAGPDTLSYASYASGVSVTLLSSTSAGFSSSTATGLAAFSGIDTLAGHAGSTLNGENVASTWALGGTTTYTDASAHSLTFSAFGTLQGGSGADTFNITSNTTASLNGGGGTNAYVFSNGKVLTGSIIGGSGTDTLDLSAYTSAVSVTLTGSGSTGFTGTSTGVSAGFSGIDVIQAGSGANTLTGENVASTWALAGTKTYTDANAHSLTFSGFTTLQGGAAANTFNVTANTTASLKGGAGNDTFAMYTNATLTGSIDGGGGSNTLDYSNYAGAVSVNLAAGTATEVTGLVSNIQNVTGNPNGITLVGGSGNDRLVAGSGKATLIGGSGNETYVLTPGGGSNDIIIPGSGTNTLDFSGSTAGVTIDLGSLAAQTVCPGGTVQLQGPVQNFIGSAFNDTVILGAGPYASIDGGAGSNTLDFKNTAAVAVLLTGSGANGFQGSATPVVTSFTNIDSIHGGNAADSLTGEGLLSTWNLGGSPSYAENVSGGHTLSFSAFGTLQGGAAANTFNVTANTTANLNGGAGNDTFAFTPGTTLTGSVDGGPGSNTLSYAAYTTSVNVNLASGTATAVTGSISNIENATGGSGNDTLTGNGGTNILTPGGGHDTLVGGSGNETYALTPGGGSSDVIDAGSGTNTLDFSGSAAGITIDLGSSAVQTVCPGGTVQLQGPVQNFIGSAFNDTVVLGAGPYGTIDGGAGFDTLDFKNAGAVAVLLTGLEANGFQGTATPLTGGFTNIDSLNGGNAKDALTGAEVASTWTLGSSQTYGEGGHTLTLSGFGTLQGGSGGNTFTVTAKTTANLAGGAGANSYTLSPGVTLTGSITGGAGSDTLNVPGNVTLTGSGTTGFTGSNANISGGFSGIDVLGGSGTLSGENPTSTWALGSPQTYSDGAHTLTFSGYSGLRTGTGNNTFTVTVASAVSITAGSGINTLNVPGNVTLTGSGLPGSGITGFSGGNANISGGFSGIAVLNGSGTLTGENVNSTWGLGSPSTYNDGAHSLTFSGYSTLQGGSAADNFVVLTGTTANLNGGAGNNTLSGAANVTLTGSGPTGFSGTSASTGTFSGIVSLSGSGTLTGENVNSTWTLGTMQNYSDGSHVLPFSGFGTLQGGSGGNTFNVSSLTTANLVGGTGANRFTVSPNVTLHGSISGGTGSDTLSVGGNVTLTGSGPTGFSGSYANISGGFSGIDVLSGSGAPNGETLTGANVASTWALGSTQTYSDGAHTLTLSGYSTLQGGSAPNTFDINAKIAIPALRGGAGNDTFVFAAGAALTGLIDGGPGTDTLNYAAFTTPVSVNLATGNATAVSGLVSNVEDVIGGSGQNTLVGAATVTVALSTLAPPTNSLLTATATPKAPAGDTVTLTYVWKVNGQIVKTTAGTTALTDTLNLSQVGSATHGASVTVTVTPHVGNLDGPAVTSSTAVVS